MSKYLMTIRWSEDDGCYVTEVPELPGCMGDGRTREEAVRNTEEIIKVWLECEEEDKRDGHVDVSNRNQAIAM